MPGARHDLLEGAGAMEDAHFPHAVVRPRPRRERPLAHVAWTAVRGGRGGIAPLRRYLP